MVFFGVPFNLIVSQLNTGITVCENYQKHSQKAVREVHDGQDLWKDVRVYLIMYFCYLCQALWSNNK